MLIAGRFTCSRHPDRLLVRPLALRVASALNRCNRRSPQIFKQTVVGLQWRSLDGYGLPGLLAGITDDRGLFYLSVGNAAFMPRWLYASCWRRHGMVLRSRISTLENQSSSSFARVLAAVRTAKNTHNKYASTRMVIVMTL